MVERPQLPLSAVHLGLLDDDEFNASLVRLSAKMCGIRNMDVYPHADAALAALRKPNPVTIMCVHWKHPLPVGLDFCRSLRKRDSSPDPFLPIVMISEHATLEHVRSARDAGIDEFLASPFSANAFRARMISILNARRGFVDVDGFFGPDRRRGAIAEMLGVDRRSEPTELIDPVSGEVYLG